jgi:hypothetical protein
MTHTLEGWKSTIAGSQLVLGLLLVLMPWLASFAGAQAAAWTAWSTGALIALVGVAALAGHAYPAAWGNLVLGVWVIVAPWLLGFAALAVAMWSHVVLGVLVALAAATELWAEHRAPPHVHA